MNKINLLLVDDRAENLIALEALINRSDIRIIKTTDPNEALKLAWDNDIAIALLDVQMPGMDGFELAELLKNNPKTKDILIIFVTAISTESKYAVKGLHTGAIDYLYKPLDPYVTAAKVDAFIQLARAQRELIQKNRELENYAVEVNNSADIICQLEPATLRILSVNPAVEQILGYKQQDVIGKNLTDLAEGRGESVTRFKLDEMAKEGQESSTFEDRFRNFRHDIQWLECRVKRKNGLLLLNMSDITMQKNYTNELIRSRDLAEQAKRMKEGFLANMSHEIRTPINAIIALAHVLRDTGLSKEQSHILELISVSSQSLLGVINDILDLSKIEAGKFAIVRGDTNVRALARNVTDIMKYKADEKNLSLILNVDEMVPALVHADSLRLNQILMNLLSNAIKFTEKGYVNLEIKVSERKADKVKLLFIVEDSGIGISADKLEHIFDSFAQAEDDTTMRFGGTGLGLAITKKLAELKGGTLSVKSMLGKGSVFSFSNWYTIVDTTENKRVMDDEVEIVPFEKPVRVLMAEDNAINQFAARNLLKRWNVEMDIADDGQVAFEKLQQKDYDIVLMDIHMPRLNGYEAAKKIRTELPEPKRSVPIITLSASVLENEVRAAHDAGMNDVVSKPFNPKILYAKIRAYLQQQ
jgi:PAS domain S-box-containing protein